MASITLFSTIIIVMILANCGPANSAVNDSNGGEQPPRFCGKVWLNPKYVCRSCRTGRTCWCFLEFDCGYNCKEECMKMFNTTCTLNPPAKKTNRFNQFGLILVITLAIFVFFGGFLSFCHFRLSKPTL
ncbi:uncharacterized protein LOC110722575 [Chenopodium quinoa]|uniref:uncharacterized protein LOC110722575 n=1 Tax=Chenopodium quinoa TaxID=63459 RepID=UPI000B79A1F2|nr:uncharacterized protein LOC110722575 [Chenopodium quinoa]